MAKDKTLIRLIGWGVVGAAAAAVYIRVIRPWYLCWGATDEEITRPLPGDELVSQPHQVSTRAITILASVAHIWPWLVQLGQGRGGLYSYDWLENLVGCDIHNVEQVMPEFQQTAVGDRVRLGPEGYPFYTIAALEPERVLILRAGDPPQAPAPIEESWVFYLDEIAPGLTRLIVRNRRNYEPGLVNFITWQVITEPLHFVMERKMLVRIKKMVEAARR